MTRRLLGTLLLLASLVGNGLAFSPASAAQAERLPVPYNFLPSAVLGGAQTDAPGTNDWECQPSRRHPRPVVLAHGLGGNQSTNWQTYGPLLKNNCYCVFALTYGVKGVPAPLNLLGGMNSMKSSAREFKKFVERVLKATGARKVDIVGHSEGTLMLNYYVKFLGGATSVRRYVSLAPLWHGTDTAGLASLSAFGSPFGLDTALTSSLQPFFAVGPQLLTGSRFMKKMRSGGTARVPGVKYTNIVTKYDELVTPYTSGIEKGMRNIIIQDKCALDFGEHFEIAADPVAAAVVLNALDPAHRRPVPCRLVLPFVGG
jgi:triacylglycerol lipase